MYEVEWSGPALEDLFARVEQQRVADELLHVAATALDEHHPPDGGAVPPYYWRRGLTPQRREMLDAAEAFGQDHDQHEQPWHYVLYYRRQPTIRTRRRYLVLAVRRAGDILAALLDLGSPAAPARRS
jgi:hypothetical protein